MGTADEVVVGPRRNLQQHGRAAGLEEGVRRLPGVVAVIFGEHGAGQGEGVHGLFVVVQIICNFGTDKFVRQISKNERLQVFYTLMLSIWIIILIHFR